jgi:lysozyme family protein
MADFLTAVAITLVWEGGLVLDPADPGGTTNFGIASKDHPGLAVRNLTRDQAIEIYREGYWKPLYSQIAAQPIANKIFDMGVNMGVGTAVKILQRSLRGASSLGGPNPDGVFGPETLAQVNEDLTGLHVLPPYRQLLSQHYLDIVKVTPSSTKFLGGWLRRVNS